MPNSSNLNIRLPTVLQVLPALHAGGVERATVDMVRALAPLAAAQGVKTFVASAGGKLVEEIEAAGAIHLTLPLDTKNPFLVLWNALRLATLIKQYKIQVVHGRSRTPAWSAFLATILTGTTFVTTYHSTYSAKNSLKRFFNSVMVKGKGVIAISQFIAQHMRQEHAVPQEKIHLICEGIDTAYFSPEHVREKDMLDLKKLWRVGKGDRVVLLPARLVKRKGPDVFIKALSQVKTPNVVGILVGATKDRQHYRQELDQLIQSLGLSSKVRIVDGLSDVRAAYTLADCIVSVAGKVPESFGRVAAEAGALKKIVIGTRIGATPELCLHEKTGFLVPPNDPLALADQIDCVLALSDQERKVLQEAAREHIVNHFDLARMQQETLEFYSQFLVSGV